MSGETHERHVQLALGLDPETRAQYWENVHETCAELALPRILDDLSLKLMRVVVRKWAFNLRGEEEVAAPELETLRWFYGRLHQMHDNSDRFCQLMQREMALYGARDWWQTAVAGGDDGGDGR